MDREIFIALPGMLAVAAKECDEFILQIALTLVLIGFLCFWHILRRHREFIGREHDVVFTHPISPPDVGRSRSLSAP